jgi:hypothetical protein
VIGTDVLDNPWISNDTHINDNLGDFLRIRKADSCILSLKGSEDGSELLLELSPCIAWAALVYSLWHAFPISRASHDLRILLTEFVGRRVDAFFLLSLGR